MTTGPGVPSTPERTHAQRLHVVAIELAALAQNGLTYAGDRYDVSRYHRMQEMSADMLALLSDGSPEEFRQALLVEEGHATPKVAVLSALFEDDRVLLVREATDGRWTLPGGWADAMDTPSEAAAREFAEEAGIAVRIAKLAAVHDGTRHNAHVAGRTGFPWHIYKLMFIADRTDHAPPGSRPRRRDDRRRALRLERTARAVHGQDHRGAAGNAPTPPPRSGRSYGVRLTPPFPGPVADQTLARDRPAPA